MDQTSSGVDGGPIEVLYVDDDELLTDRRKALVRRQEADIRLHVEHNGSDALAYLDHADGVDCVVSDYEMPELDGIELLRSVRQRWPDLPFILFTDHDDEEVAERAITAGVTDYLRKRSGTGQFARLLNRIRNLVAQRRTQRRLEQELRTEREHFRMALETSPFVAFRLDTDLRYTWVGNAHKDFEDVDVIGKRDDELLPPEAAEVVLEPKRRALETGERVREEVTYDLPSGTVTYDLTIEPLRDESGDIVGLTCASLDLTDKKRHEQELERTSTRLERQFQLLVESVEDYAIFLLDTDGYVQTWNQGAEEIKGYTRDEIVGKHFSVFYSEEDAEAGVPERNLRQANAEGQIRDEGWRVRKDGSTFWADVRIVAIREEGELLGYAKVTRDSTGQKREQELLEQKEQLEHLIRAVSHDLKNPLNVAAGWIEFAREDTDRRALDKAAKALERSQTILEEVLTLARDGLELTEVEPVALADVAERCWNLLPAGEATLDVETDRVVLADASRLRHLFQNLLQNAIEHGGETVTVGEMNGGFYVADDGPGIPEAERERVFDPNYSSREEGTGFGLPIVEQIATIHGWEIRITESETGGARFEITGVEISQ